MCQVSNRSGKITVSIFGKKRQVAEQSRQKPQPADPRILRPSADIQKAMTDVFGANQPPPVLRLEEQPVIVKALPFSGVVLFRTRDADGPWVAAYKVVLGSCVSTEYKRLLQNYDEVKIIPWETFPPGIEQVAADDLMVTKYGQESWSFALSTMERGGEWVDWLLPCDPPSVPPL